MTPGGKYICLALTVTFPKQFGGLLTRLESNQTSRGVEERNRSLILNQLFEERKVVSMRAVRVGALEELRKMSLKGERVPRKGSASR